VRDLKRLILNKKNEIFTFWVLEARNDDSIEKFIELNGNKVLIKYELDHYRVVAVGR
jgi:hypothetical protein